MSTSRNPRQQPNFPWRMASAGIMGATGIVARTFVKGCNSLEVFGLEKLLTILDSRRDAASRQRGLITVSNHICIADDPLIWSILPWKYLFDPRNLRFGLGAHDIIYANKLLGLFFSAGQTLPTHRLHHSDLGGPFQPTMTQAIRILSSQPYTLPSIAASTSSSDLDIPDPFSSPTTPPSLTYTTTGRDLWLAPSTFLSNRHGWVHVFPEGYVHQHAERGMRYFKWGIARLILEAEPAPDVVPMFIDGTDGVFHENRTFPRFLPRVGNKIRVMVGDKVDFEETFGDLRRRWQGLVAESRRRRKDKAQINEAVDSDPARQLHSTDGNKQAATAAAKAAVPQRPQEEMLGELVDDELKYGAEAQQIRIEVARRVRAQVLKLRRELGYPDEDPKLADAATWAKDPGSPGYRSPVDGSLVRKDGT